MHVTGADARMNRWIAHALLFRALISFRRRGDEACSFCPGKYRFADFVKGGGLLTLLLVAIVLVLKRDGLLSCSEPFLTSHKQPIPIPRAIC